MRLLSAPYAPMRLGVLYFGVRPESYSTFTTCLPLTKRGDTIFSWAGSNLLTEGLPPQRIRPYPEEPPPLSRVRNLKWDAPSPL